MFDTPSDTPFFLDCLLKGLSLKDMESFGLSLTDLDMLELWHYVQAVWAAYCDCLRSTDLEKFKLALRPSGGLWLTWLDIRLVIERKLRKGSQNPNSSPPLIAQSPELTPYQ
ncbi:MAG: hypothetical protein ACXAB4_12820 [Candidatus Hodarchaeales archaeon]|jgi:hypothetical protein